MKAPTTEANRLAHSELPPTSLLTQAEGIRPSEPGRPSSSPATSTPANSRGMICLAKSQVDENQLSVSSAGGGGQVSQGDHPGRKRDHRLLGKDQRQGENGDGGATHLHRFDLEPDDQQERPAATANRPVMIHLTL